MIFYLASFLLLGSFRSFSAKYVRSTTINTLNAPKQLPKMIFNDVDDPALLPTTASLNNPVFIQIYPNTSYCSAASIVNMSTLSNGGCISVPDGLYSVLSLRVNCADSTYDSAFTVTSYVDANCVIGTFITPANGDCTCVSIIDTSAKIVGYVTVNCAGKSEICTRETAASIVVLAAIIVGTLMVSFILIISIASFCLYGFSLCGSKHDSVAPIPAAIATIDHHHHPPIAAVQMIQLPPHAVENAHYEDGLQQMRQPEVVVVGQPQHRHHHRHHHHREEGGSGRERPQSDRERPPSDRERPHRERDPNKPHRERDPNKPHRERHSPTE